MPVVVVMGPILTLVVFNDGVNVWALVLFMLLELLTALIWFPVVINHSPLYAGFMLLPISYLIWLKKRDRIVEDVPQEQPVGGNEDIEAQNAIRFVTDQRMQS